MHYLDSFFAASYTAELAATGTTRRTAHLRTCFLQSLLAALTTGTADMASHLTRAAADAAAVADDAAVAVALASLAALASTYTRTRTRARATRHSSSLQRIVSGSTGLSLGQSCARRAPKFHCIISIFWAQIA